MTGAVRGARAALAAAIVLSGLAAGCGGREYGWEGRDEQPRQKASVDAAAVAKLDAEAKALWAKRADEAQLVRAIDALKRLLAAQGGESYDTLVQLSRACYLLGEVRDDTEKKLAAYEEGMKYGDLALNTFPAFREAFAKSQKIEEAADAVGKEGIAAIYWDAVNAGKWAKAKGITKALFIKDKVKRMYERVLALDEMWFYGAAHRSLGAFWAALPSISGRDLDKSKKHFDRSLEIAPNYFATRVLVAEIWARNANDGKAYKRELRYVLDTPASSIPEVAQENEVEKRKAKRLMDEFSDYFDEEEAEAPAEPKGGSGS
jgi:hypothetical protein